jgi:hypothetical protein
MKLTAKTPLRIGVGTKIRDIAEGEEFDVGDELGKQLIDADAVQRPTRSVKASAPAPAPADAAQTSASSSDPQA